MIRSFEDMDDVCWAVLQRGVSSVDFVSIESLIRRSTRSCYLGHDAKCTSSSFHINYRLPVQSSGAFSVKFSFRGKRRREGGRGINRQSLIASDEETAYAKSEGFFLCVQALPIHKRLSKLFSMEIHMMWICCIYRNVDTVTG